MALWLCSKLWNALLLMIELENPEPATKSTSGSVAVALRASVHVPGARQAKLRVLFCLHPVILVDGNATEMTSSAEGGGPAGSPRRGGDLFDAALTLEEDHIDEGYEEGLRWVLPLQRSSDGACPSGVAR